jgi:WD40 repeat protein
MRDTDGRSAVVGLANGELWLVDADGRKRRLGSHRGAIKAVRSSADGRWIVSAGNDGLARVWTRDGVPWLDLPHPGIVHDALFRSDSLRVLTAGSDRTLRSWPVTDEDLERITRRR